MGEDRRRHYDDGFRREALEPVKAGAVYRKVSKDDSSFYDVIRGNIRCRQNGDVNGYEIMSVPYGALQV